MEKSGAVILDFEKNIVEIEAKIESLKILAKDEDVNIDEELTRLQKKLEKQVAISYSSLTPWQKAQIARHPDRPQCLDYVHTLIEDFTPLSGDRRFADDKTMIAGIGRFHGMSVAILGQQKGKDLETRVKYNFGMAKPEGYRKAQRIMDLAGKFQLPILVFVDTDGAYPGIDAEARGQAEAIAAGIEKCLQVKTPIVSTIIGMGGSGGAIAIATADKILMLENSIYSVISPEGCASILWRSADKVKEAAEALKLTAQDLKKLKVIDEIIPEPTGGAHRDREAIINKVGEAIFKNLKELIDVDGETIKKQRTEKFLAMTRNISEKEKKGK
ncbi:MAG: acetyl-CoA carboxylase carboxyltransferase subunit alpha [Lactobacillaceae bacterium]|jgi:acetyl-CoA carboxylase carboxyl transferase subunit alpha|nr:acetyl-CoA carboxylase carboxyltransferase subunit alpha [Lactobacillaceae bacterium]